MAKSANRSGALLAGALLVLLRPAAVGADDGVIEINAAKTRSGGVTASDTPGVPVTLDAPGSYRLTGNLTPSLAPPFQFIIDPENRTVIAITADDVTVDLNGFAITGPGIQGTGDGIASSGRNTVVLNGAIRGVGRDGVALGEGARVESCVITGSGRHGISTGPHSRVSDCTVLDSSGFGLNLDSGSGFGGNVLAGNNGGDEQVQVATQGRAIFEISTNICAGAPTCSIEAPPVKRVFVASRFSGNLGGIAGADATCNDHAATAGLSGTYLAWLSDGVVSPDTRFTRSPGSYVLVDGTLVALDYVDLTDGTLLSPINLTADGSPPFPTRVWTNVTPDGLPTGLTAGFHCNGWLDPTSSFSGSFGLNTAADTTWTAAGSITCDLNQVFIYCFEQ